MVCLVEDQLKKFHLNKWIIAPNLLATYFFSFSDNQLLANENIILLVSLAKWWNKWLRIQSNFIKTLAFYIQLCASISGLSHAFIFGMAHSLIRRRIFVMLKLNKYCTEQAPRLSQNSVFPMTNLN
ncbi:putative integral membrane protein [Brugia pahangi]